MDNRPIRINPLSAQEYLLAPKLPVVLVLDNVRSGNNTGSVFRSADAFRIEEILLTGITATPPQKDILKSSLGAELSVRWRHFNTTIEAVTLLKSAGITVIALEQTTEAGSLKDFSWPPQSSSIAYVLGNEVKGVSPEVIAACDGSVHIPMFGTKHSLNVAVCAGIVLWHTMLAYSTFKDE